MLQKIDKWIDQTLDTFSDKKQSCNKFTSEFSGFYSGEFLSNSYFVVVDEIPKPKFPELYEAGLGEFVDMDVSGITYKNTYFVKSPHESELSLHFHELVHVLQWGILGAEAFILRYISEIQNQGYESAPLEKMAYELQDYFMKNNTPLDIADYVQQKI